MFGLLQDHKEANLGTLLHLRLEYYHTYNKSIFELGVVVYLPKPVSSALQCNAVALKVCCNMSFSAIIHALLRYYHNESTIGITSKTLICSMRVYLFLLFAVSTRGELSSIAPQKQAI